MADDLRLRTSRNDNNKLYKFKFKKEINVMIFLLRMFPSPTGAGMFAAAMFVCNVMGVCRDGGRRRDEMASNLVTCVWETLQERRCPVR